MWCVQCLWTDCWMWSEVSTSVRILIIFTKIHGVISHVIHTRLNVWFVEAPYYTIPPSPVGTSSLDTQIPALQQISLKDSQSPLVSQYHVQTSQSHKKAVTYYFNTYYRCTVGLGKKCISISIATVVFGWAVRVAVVQLSSGLTTNVLFCMYLQSVTVCAAIYRLDW